MQSAWTRSAGWASAPASSAPGRSSRPHRRSGLASASTSRAPRTTRAPVRRCRRRPPTAARRGGCRSRRRARARCSLRLVPPQRPLGSVTLGQREVVAIVALAHGLLVAGGREALGGVGADRLKHPQPRSGPCACWRRTSRLLATRRSSVSRPAPVIGFRRVDRRAAGEHCEAREASLLVVAEQVVAPVDRRAQRLLARRRVAGARRPARRAPRPGVPRSRSGRAARSGRPRARSPAAARRRAGRSPRPPRRCRRRDRSSGSWARARSPNSATASTPASASGSSASRVGQRQRRDGVALLGLQRERLAAGGEHRQRGTGAQQGADERRGGEHVLEVVGDQQQVLGGEEAFGRLAGRLAREHDDPERR